MKFSQVRKKSKKVDEVADLSALMLRRGKERSEDVFASLEAKYGGKGGGGKKKKRKRTDRLWYTYRTWNHLYAFLVFCVSLKGRALFVLCK